MNPLTPSEALARVSPEAAEEAFLAEGESPGPSGPEAAFLHEGARPEVAGPERAFLAESEGAEFRAADVDRVGHWVSGEGVAIPTERPIHGGDLNKRFKGGTAQLDATAEWNYQNRADFRARVDSPAKALQAAEAAGDSGAVARIETQIKQGLTGFFAELLGLDALNPYFEKCKVQVRELDGATIVDFEGKAAKCPIRLKGSDRIVPQGGDLRVEFKVGQKSYLLREIVAGHLEHQSLGQRPADMGITIMSKDYNDLAKELGLSGRQTMRSFGSPIFCFFPRKEELDRTMLSLTRRVAAGAV
jgi:hypothetical protein